MKRTIALFLTFVMLFALAVPMVSATEGEQASPTYPSYGDAKDGQLLYRVDFRSKEVFKYANMNNTVRTATPSVDGNSITLNPGTAEGYYCIGGEIDGLALDGSRTYTIDFTTTLPSTGIVGFGPSSSVKPVYAFAMKTDRAKRETAEHGNGISSSWTKYTNISIDGGKYSFRFVVDEAAATVTMYYLNTSKVWADLGIAGTGFNQNSDVTKMDKLQLFLGNYSKNSTVISDVNIYKGNLGTTYVYGGYCGEELYNVDFREGSRFEYSNINNIPGTATPSADGRSVTLLDREASRFYAIGGEVKGLPFTEESNYTIDFTTDHPSTFYIGLDTRSSTNANLGSYGFAIHKSNGVKAENGFTTTGWVKGAQAFTTYRLVIDVAKAKVDFYYLNASGNWVYAVTGNGLPSDLDTLTLCFGTYATTETVISDVKIYSTTDFVEVIDGDESEFVTVDGENYTLPTAKKAGYMFKGWRVNGSEMKNSGESVPVATLEKLEKIFVPVMQETVWQCAENKIDSTKRDVRFVSVIDSTDYERIGYDVVITYGGNSYTTEGFVLKYVYGSLKASYGAEQITLETLKYDPACGGYLTAFVLEGVPTNVGTITVELKPYQQTVGGEKKYNAQSIVVELTEAALLEG